MHVERFVDARSELSIPKKHFALRVFQIAKKTDY
jgi:hypothetical protein